MQVVSDGHRDVQHSPRRDGNLQDYVDHSTAQLELQAARLAAATISDHQDTSRSTQASTMAPSNSPRKRGSAGTSSEKTNHNTKSNNSHRHQHVVEDQSFQVGNKNLRVKGTSKTYDAIAKGNAIIVQCASCKAIMQVGATAKLLYCSLCQNVTPVKLAQEQLVVDPHQQGQNYDPQELDARISRTIQNQEKDVALARKLAKTSR